MNFYPFELFGQRLQAHPSGVLWWPDEGVDHSRTMLVTEISYLDNDFRRSVVTSDPARFAKRFADNSYHYLFEVTRFVDFIQWVSLPPRKVEWYSPPVHLMKWSGCCRARTTPPRSAA